ncbi:MAG: hypothetical protein QM820_12960 [Minicystis sp.]
MRATFHTRTSSMAPMSPAVPYAVPPTEKQHPGGFGASDAPVTVPATPSL